MADHHTAQSCPDRSFKRIKFHTVQPLASERKHRQRLMRINIRISMTGKMLAYRQYSSFFQAGCVSDNLICHLYRIFSERTGINHRILRIDIHIRHRSKINLSPNLFALAGYFTPIRMNQPIVLNTAQHHISRENRCAAQTHCQPPFSIESNHNRYFGLPLRPIRQVDLVLQFSTGKKKSAHFISINGFTQQFQISFGIHRSDGIDK